MLPCKGERRGQGEWHATRIKCQKSAGVSVAHTPCCENTDAEAINFCHLLARVGDKYLHSAILPSVSLTSNGDNLGSWLSGFATEMWE